MTIDLEEYEKIIAYKAITDATYLNTIADFVKPEYFEDSTIAFYFKIVNEFYSKRKKLPTFTEIKAYLTTDLQKKNFKKLLTSFKELDKKFDRDELYENTERFLKERAAWCRITDIAENVEDRIKNPHLVLSAFDDICKISLNYKKALELYGDFDKVADDIENVERYISSTWPWLDKSLGGGFLEKGKALYMFAGQSNIGKSIFLGNIAENISAQGKNVLVISLEMSDMVYAKRISSKITKIPLSQFKDNVPSLRHRMQEEKKEKGAGKIFIKDFPPSKLTVKQLEAYIQKLIDSGERIDAVVIDYISLMKSDFGVNSYERIKHICEEVRALSYIFECPFISAVQMNRAAYSSDNPGMEGIAESIGVAATADVIISIFQSEEDLELNIIKLGMMKNRYGPRGMVQPMRIEYDILTVYQANEEEELMEDEGDLSVLERLAAV